MQPLQPHDHWHKTLKGDAVRPAAPESPEQARAVVAKYGEYYNSVRLHSAIGYIAPNDLRAGRGPAIFADRDRKLAAARERRRIQRNAVAITEAAA